MGCLLRVRKHEFLCPGVSPSSRYVSTWTCTISAGTVWFMKRDQAWEKCQDSACATAAEPPHGGPNPPSCPSYNHPILPTHPVPSLPATLQSPTQVYLHQWASSICADLAACWLQHSQALHTSIVALTMAIKPFTSAEHMFHWCKQQIG